MILAQDEDDDENTTKRALRGRFLHLTDMHPDPFYRTGSVESTACHRRKKNKKKKKRGGDFGLPFACVFSFLSKNSCYPKSEDELHIDPFVL